MISVVMDSLDTLFNAVGIIGMVGILLAYFMLQLGRWQAHKPHYLYTNIIGSSCLIVSLCWSWNLALFLLQCAWIMISGYGLIKYYRKARKG